MFVALWFLLLGSIWFLLHLFLANVVFTDIWIFWFLMKNITVYVICIVTFIVQTSHFYRSFSLRRWICYCSCCIASAFFLPLLLFSSDVWYAGFIDLIPSVSLPSAGILVFWKKFSASYSLFLQDMLAFSSCF